MVKRYPLEAARTVRTHAQDSAEIALRDARARLSGAVAQLEALQRTAAELAHARDESLGCLDVTGAEHDARTVVSSDSQRTPRPGTISGVRRIVTAAATSGAQLALAGAWTTRLREREREHAKLVARARSELRSRERAVRLAELTLQQAYIQREVIERHHARFAQTERKRVERALEAEEDDLAQHAHAHARSRS
jgi:hypothetical protein